MDEFFHFFVGNLPTLVLVGVLVVAAAFVANYVQKQVQAEDERIHRQELEEPGDALWEKNDTYRCPRCRSSFNVSEAEQWSEDRHVPCGQRLRLIDQEETEKRQRLAEEKRQEKIARINRLEQEKLRNEANAWQRRLDKIDPSKVTISIDTPQGPKSITDLIGDPQLTRIIADAESGRGIGPGIDRLIEKLARKTDGVELEKRIGRSLWEAGGIPLMQAVYHRIRRVSFGRALILATIWDGIGEWDSNHLGAAAGEE